jgi:dienelactone hydrolase
MRLVLLATALVVCGSAKEPGHLLWGSLQPGSYTVGYRSYFEVDPLRDFGSAKKRRPVLVAIWYPAIADGSKRMPYGAYWRVPDLRADAEFRSRLQRFLLDTVCSDLFQKKHGHLLAKERKFFDALRVEPTMAHFDARPHHGRFPVLLYHPGAAGSLEENSVLCEYLASHGYVAITSAFPSPDGQHVSNNYGGPQTFWKDLAFLLKHARTLGFADAGNAGAFGHSMGAQYLLEWVGRGSPLRAVVSLDSTLEYTSDDFAGHRALRDQLAGLQPADVPVLLAVSADRKAGFGTWERYLPARAEAFVRYFNHGDFLLHGSLARMFSGDRTTGVHIQLA